MSYTDLPGRCAQAQENLANADDDRKGLRRELGSLDGMSTDTRRARMS